eukprot:341046-Alexandrium_andersonii.AAC.1
MECIYLWGLCGWWGPADPAHMGSKAPHGRGQQGPTGHSPPPKQTPHTEALHYLPTQVLLGLNGLNG